ncbi:hypothetical protein ACFO5R_07715 [Halosolutus amylolyticus]|uniref:Rpa-associated protein n=1 Tax=Halosolutus amylolyticus TaxID=2932267 RepID=A0ABD5PMW1_9EURY|nr:hypothetical protein [Halosolutus amylolyticus]
MSASNDGDEEIPGREIAYRVFAAEYDDADLSYAESDEERAPNYVITPTGARLNRLFAVGTLTEVTSVNDEMVRARVVDPTGAFVVYAGQYQPDALATLERLDPPAFVAVTGKARTFQPEDSDRVYTSIRPETIATIDADTRDRWVVSTAERTLDRVGTYAAAAQSDASRDALERSLEQAGVENGLASGLPIALDHYGTTADYLGALRDRTLEAVEVVADEREQVRPLDLGPQGTSADGEASFADLPSLTEVDLSAIDSIEADAADADEAIAAAGAGTGTASESESAETDDVGTGSAAGTASARVESDESTGTVDASTAAESDADDEAAVTASTSGATVESEDGAAEMETDTSTESDATAGSGTTTESDATAESDTPAESDATAESDTPAESDAPVETESDAESDELGDFDAGGSTAKEGEIGAESDGDDEAIGVDDDDLGDFDASDAGDGMYEMDEEEREQIEEEFGTEFTTGADVEDPGDSDIDVPATDEVADDADQSESGEAAAEDAATMDDDSDDTAVATDETADVADETDEDLVESADDADDADEDTDTDEDADESAEDVDLEDYVVDTMTELDDGDGADRTTLVETVADETGADESDVEDAIQDALMGGQCYEPDDETLKPI